MKSNILKAIKIPDIIKISLVCIYGYKEEGIGAISPGPKKVAVRNSGKYHANQMGISDIFVGLWLYMIKL